MIFPSNHHRADEAQKSWQHRKSECTGSVVLCLCVQRRGRVEVFHGGAEENAGTKEACCCIFKLLGLGLRVYGLGASSCIFKQHGIGYRV